MAVPSALINTCNPIDQFFDRVQLPMYNGTVTKPLGLYFEYPMLNAMIVRMILMLTTIDALVIQILGGPTGFGRPVAQVKRLGRKTSSILFTMHQ